ncbi:MAG: NAD-dependent protein deacylase [Oscillospiraceae bacterium]|nr:NAD-dependent protein deacylase [Oscillospiraceae bacterium]
MKNTVKDLQEAFEKAKTVVFFGGAGVSTESGIPDFRSVDGLYHQKYDYPPETILSNSFFMSRTKEFYRFYRDKLLSHDAKPNAAHLKLAEWEQNGRLNAVITQNIDGLHQAAGSRKVLELHGSVLRNYCMKCRKSYSVEAIRCGEDVPRCSCGGVIKPDVVLYEEALDNDVMEEAIRCIQGADMMIIGGTSLVVYPAAGLIRYFQGSTLALVNRDATPMDARADIVVHEKIGEVFSRM